MWDCWIFRRALTTRKCISAGSWAKIASAFTIARTKDFPDASRLIRATLVTTILFSSFVAVPVATAPSFRWAAHRVQFWRGFRLRQLLDRIWFADSARSAGWF